MPTSIHLSLGDDDELRGQRLELDPEQPETVLRELGRRPGPNVLVVSREPFERLAELDEVSLGSRAGSKDRRRSLAAYLLARNHGGAVPAIFAEFQSLGSLKRSILPLLANATRAGRDDLYLIGVEARRLEDLAGWADEGERAARPSRQVALSQRLVEAMGELDRPDEIEKLRRIEEIIRGSSTELDAVRRLVLCSPRVDRPILVLGETGTGKEVVARAIHEVSREGKGEYRAINCAAMTETLFDSELFGYVKGAFTGAIKDTDGIWVRVENGTLFLDEVGELTLSQQAKLLRVLQTDKVRRLGEVSETQVHAKVVAATNRDLAGMVQRGEFRSDLYQRLSRGLVIVLPPLRHSRSALRHLATHFWREYESEAGALSEETLREILAYPWPGNVRQLKGALEKLSALFPGRPANPERLRIVLELEESELAGLAPQPAPPGSPPVAPPSLQTS